MPEPPTRTVVAAHDTASLTCTLVVPVARHPPSAPIPLPASIVVPPSSPALLVPLVLVPLVVPAPLVESPLVLVPLLLLPLLATSPLLAPLPVEPLLLAPLLPLLAEGVTTLELLLHRATAAIISAIARP